MAKENPGEAKPMNDAASSRRAVSKRRNSSLHAARAGTNRDAIIASKISVATNRAKISRRASSRKDTKRRPLRRQRSRRPRIKFLSAP